MHGEELCKLWRGVALLTMWYLGLQKTAVLKKRRNYEFQEN
jgi:hypothetical protein